LQSLRKLKLLAKVMQTVSIQLLMNVRDAALSLNVNLKCQAASRDWAGQNGSENLQQAKHAARRPSRKASYFPFPFKSFAKLYHLHSKISSISCCTASSLKLFFDLPF
jgi:hypothetical protein